MAALAMRRTPLQRRAQFEVAFQCGLREAAGQAAVCPSKRARVSSLAQQASEGRLRNTIKDRRLLEETPSLGTP
jgi:hypothetical protein